MARGPALDDAPIRPAEAADADLRQALMRRLFRSGLYRLMLRARPPRTFFAVAPDQWPGDAGRGERLLMGEFAAHGAVGRVDLPDDPPWRRAESDPAWLAELNGFGWLRDLRDCRSQLAANMAAAKVEEWIETQARWSDIAWAPDILSRRLVNWIRHYDFLAAGAIDGFSGRFVGSVAVQLAHLRRATRGLAGARLLGALKGLAYGDLAFLRESAAHRRGLDATLARVKRFLPRYIAADGVVGERSPALQLQALRDLIDLRAGLLSAEHPGPPELQAAIDRLAPMLRFFRHGDGGLALFNGAQEGDRDEIDLVLARSGSASRAPAEAVFSGFQRLQAGGSCVIADTGSPPPRGLDAAAHAGTLSFEFSAGRDRVVVNCGGYDGADPEWRKAVRFTAAHSTATLDDVNSSEITEFGAIEHRAGNVTAQRQEADGAVWIEAQHDGYRSLYGAIHRRRLYLSADGGDLRGEDTLAGPDGRPVGEPGRKFALRFHLHPTVDVSLAQGGGSALLRLAGGKGWRMRATGAAMGLTESVYLGLDGQIRRAEQIVLIGAVPSEGCKVKWALTRVDG